TLDPSDLHSFPTRRSSDLPSFAHFLSASVAIRVIEFTRKGVAAITVEHCSPPTCFALTMARLEQLPNGGHRGCDNILSVTLSGEAVKSAAKRYGLIRAGGARHLAFCTELPSGSNSGWPSRHGASNADPD